MDLDNRPHWIYELLRSEYLQLLFPLCLQLCQASGSSLGYGISRVMSKPKVQSSDSSDESQVTEGTLAI